jgi:hypothetical protein
MTTPKKGAPKKGAPKKALAKRAPKGAPKRMVAPARSSEGPRQAVAMPYEPPKGPNRFVPSKALAAADVKVDRKMLRSVVPTPRRPRTEPVEAECDRCGATQLVSPRFLVRGEGDGKLSYRCNGCSGASR